MGDTHFIIRHGLTGFVFLAFFILGLMVLVDLTDLLARLTGQDPEDEADLIARLAVMFQGGEESGSFFDLATTLIAIFLATPVIGVVIQGLHVAAIYLDESAWKDPARREVAELIRSKLRHETFEGLQEETRKRYPRILDSVGTDSLFVWLYYSQAPEHMIDWARRRRSYHYLGENWVLAAAVGFSCGLVAPAALKLDKPELLTLLVVASLLWAAGTLWVADRMKRDADDMEFVWAMSRRYPDVFKALLPDERRPEEVGSRPSSS